VAQWPISSSAGFLSASLHPVTRPRRLFARVFRQQLAEWQRAVLARLMVTQREERDDEIDQKTRDADHYAGDGQGVSLLAGPFELVESERA
jgi:hypothetical protein